MMSNAFVVRIVEQGRGEKGRRRGGPGVLENGGTSVDTWKVYLWAAEGRTVSLSRNGGLGKATREKHNPTELRRYYLIIILVPATLVNSIIICFSYGTFSKPRFLCNGVSKRGEGSEGVKFPVLWAQTRAVFGFGVDFFGPEGQTPAERWSEENEGKGGQKEGFSGGLHNPLVIYSSYRVNPFWFPFRPSFLMSNCQI